MGRRSPRAAGLPRPLPARKAAGIGNRAGAWGAVLIWDIAETDHDPAGLLGASCDATVHVTGHSLGGYLAQVGAAELLGTPWAERLQAVECFNGIGLDYALWAGLSPEHAEERAALEGYADRTGALVGHRVFGDPCSASTRGP